VLSLTEYEILKATANTASIRRPTSKPLLPSRLQRSNRIIAMRPGDTHYAARPQAPVHFAEMEIEIRQVFDYMVGIHAIERAIWKREFITQISPHIRAT
jgi:hypothetical protein